MSIMPILPEIVTFVKLSEENSERVINKKILIAYALWEMIYSQASKCQKSAKKKLF